MSIDIHIDSQSNSIHKNDNSKIDEIIDNVYRGICNELKGR